MQVSSATTDLESKGTAISDSSSVKRKEPEDNHQIEKIRCPCGSSLRNSLIQVTLIVSCSILLLTRSPMVTIDVYVYTQTQSDRTHVLECLSPLLFL